MKKKKKKITASKKTKTRRTTTRAKRATPAPARAAAAPMMAAALAPPSPERRDFIERRVWRFSRTPNEQSGASYVDPNCTFPDFKAGSVSDLIFHQNDNTGPVLDNNVQEFARGLHNHLGDNNVQPNGNPAEARGAIEEAARAKDSPMQSLLDTVVDNYQ